MTRLPFRFPAAFRLLVGFLWRCPWPAVLVACLVGSGLLSVYLGQDNNWDLKNYHVYNPWALLNDRAGIDFFAAGVQTYFSPFLDLPYYMLAFEWLPHRPRLVAFLAGLPFGVLVCVTLYLTNRVLADLALPKAARLATAALAVALGTTGAATLPQVGTTFNEIQVAALMACGLAVLLREVRGGTKAPLGHGVLLGGLLFGLAAGLKLTASIYAPATALALLASVADKPRAARAMLVFSLGWCLAFSLAYGWWGYQLYAAHGNPVFPLFEGLFGSRGLGPSFTTDNRFKPTSLVQSIFYPFFWIGSSVPTVAEPLFSDARFALAMLSGGGLAATWLLTRRGMPLASRGARFAVPRTSVFVMVFVAVAYVIWLKMFSILRYAVSIEVLLGLVVAIAMAIACQWFLRPAHSVRALLVCMAVLVAGVAATTRYPAWGRAGYGKTVLRVSPVALAPQSMLFVVGPPQAFVLPSIASQHPTVRFVGVTDAVLSARGYGLWNQLMRLIADFSGPMYVMVRNDQPELIDLSLALGLRADQGNCQRLSSSLDADYRICVLHRTGQ